MDYDSTCGYVVRVPIDRNKYKSTFFSDGTYGGKLKALRAARSFRDTEVKARKIKLTTKRTGRAHATQKNNNSGVVGVFQYYNSSTAVNPSGWAAVWRANNKFYKRYFSSALYTDKGAFEKACIARIKNAGELYIIDVKKKLPISRRKIKSLNEAHRNANI